MLGTSAAAVLIGAISFYSNGVSHDTNVSTFALTMQNPEVSGLVHT
jgi:hypothetical protein